MEDSPSSPKRSWMLSHRYTRRILTQNNPSDSYNALGSTPHNDTARSSHGAASSQLEYWTNGTTTHLMAVPAPQSTSVVTPTTGHRPTVARFHTRRYAHPQPSSRASLSSTEAEQHRDIQKKNVVRNSILAGSVSGMVSTVALYPLDVLRTKCQAAALRSTTSAMGSRAGPLAVLVDTVRTGGIRALYTGLPLPLAAQLVYKSTVFTVHNVTKTFLLDWHTLEHAKLGRSTQHVKLSYADTAVAGFVAGAINGACFVTPVELVRNQLIAQDSKIAAGQLQTRQTSWQVVQSTVQRYGISTLWRGMGATIVRDGFGVAAFFCTQRAVSSYLKTTGFSTDNNRPSLVSTLIAGACAGLSYWVVSLPMDTAKTWIQSGDLSQPPVRVADELRETLRTGGGPLGVAKLLLRGWQVAYSRGMPSAALTIATYTTVYRTLEGGDM